ncbi:PBP1 and LysM peptidoglycan-binding domain-containing protein [Porphyromonas loveana]|uniref:PBP1 and LysM peptidoglycan-binding domain-containing protein n=1 Tax=Porphyromonas loveana TaxID=1884669 RepID=UPI00359F23FD
MREVIMTHNMYWKRILSVIIIGLGLTFVQPATAQTRNRTKVHTVQAKETVYSLARQYGLTEEDIYTLNPSAKGGIKEGQTLLIPAKSVSAATPHAAPPGGEHVIQPQETLFSVSRKYGLSEVALLKANPGITAANFPAGYRLHIPRGESAPVATAPSVQTGKAIEVGLMLPLSGNIQRYVEFYEGMLMGLFRLKKKGVSVTLRVYDVSNTSDAEDVVHSGELNDCHLIIGGTSNDQISVIGRYADRRGINYVVPFSSGKIAGKASANLFQINPPQEYIYPYVARAFMQRFADRSVVFVTGRDEPDACASYIMAEMDKAGRTYSKLAADTGQGELVKMLHALLALIPN